MDLLGKVLTLHPSSTYFYVNVPNPYNILTGSTWDIDSFCSGIVDENLLPCDRPPCSNNFIAETKGGVNDRQQPLTAVDPETSGTGQTVAPCKGWEHPRLAPTPPRPPLPHPETSTAPRGTPRRLPTSQQGASEERSRGDPVTDSQNKGPYESFRHERSAQVSSGVPRRSAPPSTSVCRDSCRVRARAGRGRRPRKSGWPIEERVLSGPEVPTSPLRVVFGGPLVCIVNVNVTKRSLSFGLSLKKQQQKQ